jgi:hypothetical protein
MIASVATALAWPAAAQAVCGEREKFIDHLSNSYAEAPVAIGLASNGNVLEVLKSDKAGTWTIIVTRPNGMSCVVASGEAWEELPKLALGPAA